MKSKKQKNKKLKEAKQKGKLKEQFLMPGMVSVDDDDWKYKSLGKKSDKELTPLQQSRMHKIAYWLYENNAMANRLINMITDYVIAEGIKIESKDENVKTILMKFWNDYDNNMDLKLRQKVSDLSLYGEQAYPVIINKLNGFVKLSYIDPINIKEVNLDSENPEIIREVIVKTGGNGGTAEKPFKIIRRDDDPNSLTYGKLIGDCFFFAINKVSNVSRGRSDLLALMDYLDGYDQFLFNVMDRVSFLNNFVWSVTYTGMNQQEIEIMAKKEGSPNPGSVFRHNEKVKWDAVTPDLKAADMSEIARLIRIHILGSKGIPESYFGSGSETNLATAQAQQDPVVKMFKARQKYVKYMIYNILEFVLDQAKIAGILEDKESEFEIIFPEISTKNINESATALANVTSSLAIAQDKGWVSSPTAMRVFATMLNQFGVEVDTTEEEKKVDEEIEEETLSPYANIEMVKD